MPIETRDTGPPKSRRSVPALGRAEKGPYRMEDPNRMEDPYMMEDPYRMGDRASVHSRGGDEGARQISGGASVRCSSLERRGAEEGSTRSSRGVIGIAPSIGFAPHPSAHPSGW